MEPLTTSTTRRAVMAAAVVSFTATIVFGAAFQLSKADAISAISPFAEDPPDAVGSIAVQVALAGSLIGLIRWLRLHGDAEFSPDRARLVLPGCQLVVVAIAITVITDLVAIARAPMSPTSPWEAALIGGLITVGAMGAASSIATRAAGRRLTALPRGEERPTDHTLAGLIEDGLIAVGRAGGWIGRRIPAVGALIGRSSRPAHRAWDWLNRSWASPRNHPWRFVVSFALLAGAWLLLARFVFEGPPPNVWTGLIVVAIFFGVEMAAVLGGYLILGGWLGIRPPLRRRG